MNVIEELYYGNIRPTDEPQSVEVRKALSEVTEIEEALGESLIDKGQKEKYQSFRRDTISSSR